MNMKKKITKGLLLAAVLFSANANAQSARDSVETTVRHLFEGMITVDTSLLATCFAPGAILQTIALNKEGKEYVRTESLESFTKSIASLSKGDADEQIVFGSVQIDGSLASVWTPYKFYYKSKFSHCGANSFQLVRIDKGWKIQYLIDTRRRQGCN